ncbi:hypothetical protein FGADI_13132 [Fusarium gaditjirri]|uniref:Uncharacterized protein n=1 Tax=Fusarium gaditjirri TaxID=282569 RepID=A0A8H4WNB0_9HYPO|nr:hypothetical protein FGADI_13132 [Fusarium gaditjirri]
MMNQPKGDGRAGSTILQAFLFLFTITNFLTLILNAATSSLYWDKQKKSFNSAVEPELYFEYYFPSADFDIDSNFYGRSAFMKNSIRPYLLLAVVAGITWAIASIALLFLFTKIRHFNHRVARYVFRVTGVATFVFLVIFYLTWAHTNNFDRPFWLDWTLGKAAVIMAHINLLLGIFVTLLAAVLDTPKDWADHAPTGPNSRLTSQA